MITEIRKQMPEIKTQRDCRGGLNLPYRLGQSVIEYFVIMTAILAVILSTGVIDNMRAVFVGYFNNAVEHMR